MNVWRRWGVFNAIGALGMAVQLVSLALLKRGMGGHYLWATAAAIELTLLHNFAWHWRWTWRERRASIGWWPAMMRFQAANGAVSMLGNLVLMRLLVGAVGMPVVAANGIAILCCSLLNFRVGDAWVFGSETSNELTIRA
jgi:putative flippase GtrA